MRRIFLIILVLISCFGFLGVSPAQAANATPWWEFQSVDTMKYSRDPSREFLGKLFELETLAQDHTSKIAATGATHIGIATPYDDEFLPVLQIWVNAARQNNLKIWFRGNWSGWEQWFGYDKITRLQHLQKTKQFIESHPELFQDGDVFSACPECENGGPGDPRMNGDLKGHRNFLIDEYQMMQIAFRGINRNVAINYNSMNGDVAALVMDKPTTQALGGLVVVDHYVRTPEKLNNDITALAEQSGGKVILGEYGAPIPDIHGSFSDKQQAQWIDESLALLQQNPNLIGLNYWTNVGGSTQIWNEDGSARSAVAVLEKYFKPEVFSGVVRNTLRGPLANATVTSSQHRAVTNKEGSFSVPVISGDTQLEASAPGFYSKTFPASDLQHNENVVLTPMRFSILYRLRSWIGQLLRL